MKTTKLMCAALALVAFAACNKQEVDTTPALDSDNKMVSITIENVANATKANEAGLTTPGTNGQSAVVKVADLKILFANASGVILKSMPLVGTSAGEHTENSAQYAYGDAANGTYLYHNVPAAVTQIAVARWETDDITIVEGTTNLTAVEGIASDEEKNLTREIDDIILYATQTLTKGSECVEIEGTQYYIYNAAVTVAPEFARLEITNIECTNLGEANHDTDVNTFGYDNLALKSLVWNTKYNLLTDYTNLALTYNVETKAHSVIAPATDKVWSWNVLPQKFTAMNLAFNASAYDYTVAKEDVALNIVGLASTADATTGDVSLAAKNIYRLNIEFEEGDITGEEGLCVSVTVTIDSWKVNPVYPVFGN